ncbi:MAG: type I DNA topoisomerase [Trueperaceae bacterium]|nr:type I DNA topoisomerase [Trueperaceae bacterium]
MSKAVSSTPKRLVIVESPTKARTIRRFLPGNNFQIEASMGHVRDLPSKAAEIPEQYKGKDWARIGVNVDENFEPLYIVSPDKKKVVAKLKDALKAADELYIATDEDREGESIGWHLVQLLNPKVPVKRMVFHEITEDAILRALNETREIDRHLVDAQEARRVLDRLVGYTISPLLWKKVAPRLSAGRVQSVAVRLMVLREKERLAFVPANYWDIKAELNKNSSSFEATMTHYQDIRLASGRDFDDNSGKLKTNLIEGKDVLLLKQETAERLAQTFKSAPWQVSNLEEREASRKASAPFTTSTLQQEASRKLNLSARDTMRTAQKLYENGYITYMRTDSTNLSQEAIDASRRAITKRYGSEYLSPSPRQFATKSRNAQEAHEAIRPAGKEMKTYEEHHLSGIEGRLYDLIWKRTVASQMADARLKFTTATIEVKDKDDTALFRASGRTILFPGFFRAYVEGSDDPEAALDDQDQPLPALGRGDQLGCNKLGPIGHETKAPARFTEASLVKLLEQEGIGRPSTYASIIDTVISRGYAHKQGSQLIPSFTAFAVNNLMEEQFDRLVDTAFTANMEQNLDDIATGQLEAIPYLKNFYQGNEGLENKVQDGLEGIDAREVSTMSFPKWGDVVVRVGRFGPYAEATIEGEKRTSSLPPDAAPADLDENYFKTLLSGQAKDDSLGTFPDTGETMYLRQGPYGPYVQLGDDSESKPKRVSLPKGLEPDQVDESTAIKLLLLPKTLGKHPESGDKIVANIGRFGPYVQQGKTFVSIPKDESVLDIGLDRALELIAKKANKNQALRVLGEHPETGESIEIRDGRYGPYVKHQKTNASLGSGQSIENLTLAEALDLLAAREAAKPSKAKKTKKTSTKKATKKSEASRKKSNAPKATPQDLEKHLSLLDSQDQEIVSRLEGMKGNAKESIVDLADRLGLSEEEIQKAHKSAMFKLRMAYGRARNK